MSQLLSVGTSALRPVFDDPAGSRTYETDTAIFERLPMTHVPPFRAAGAPRLRLVEGEDRRGGGRSAVAAAAGPARAAHRPVRLTHRGRLVLVVLLALVATAVLFAVGLVPSQASTGASLPPLSPGAAGAHTLIAQPGDTLWSIAVRIAPGVDPRVTVQRVIDANHLGGVSIEAGQTLVLPS
jgi:hypothetical protein